MLRLGRAQLVVVVTPITFPVTVREIARRSTSAATRLRLTTERSRFQDT